jgi:hypothetical protein
MALAAAGARGQGIHDTTVLEERSNLWTRIWGSVLGDYGEGVAVDGAGYAYVVGGTDGAFDGQTNAGSTDLCLSRFAPDGTRTWTRIWGSTNYDCGWKVALDRATNIYVAGSSEGSFDGQTNAGEMDLCLTKFSADGTRAWTRIWGSTNFDISMDIAVDDLTNIYVAGHTLGAFDGQTNAGLFDFCLTKFNPAGERQWSRLWGSASNDLGMSLALETPPATCLQLGSGNTAPRAASNIYVAGETDGAFDGQTNAGLNDICMSKWTAEGDKTWTRIWGSASNEGCKGLALDASGNLYVGGNTYGVFGGQTNYGGSDYCLTKYNGGGTQVWVRIWGSPSNEYSERVVLDSAGNPCVGGMTAGAFDGQTNNGVFDMFITKLNTGGTRAWTRIWGSISNDYLRGLAQDAVGHIWVTGFTPGAFDGQTNSGSDDFCLTKWGFTAPGAAPYVCASDGTYTYKILVSWGAATNAFGYRVWRNTVNDSASAEEQGSASSAYWYDTTAVPGTLYWYWVKATNDVGVGALSAGDSGWRRSQASTDNAPSDLDGDRKKDPTVYQDTTGDWLVLLSASCYQRQQASGFGGAGYLAVSGDYDGDGKTDPAIYSPGAGLWMVMLSGSSYATASLAGFGGPAFTPVPADYDGDGKTDPALYQEGSGTWIVKLSKSSYAEASTSGFGGSGFRPVFGDFDGDGLDDPGVYSESGGIFMIMRSGSGYAVAQATGFGGAGFRAVHGDFDADRKVDPAVYQEATGTWLILLSASGYTQASLTGFGAPGYTAISGDFDQDYKADPTVYKSDTGDWYIMMSGHCYQITTLTGFGGIGYSPMP